MEIDKGVFKCDSPDELCLISYCQYWGGKLLAKEGNVSTIEVNGAKEEWTLHKILEFSSERKRMSVLASCASLGRFSIFSKGADDMILSRSIKGGEWDGMDMEENYHRIIQHLQEYADKGLRTLVMATKDLLEDDFFKYVTQIDEASKVIENREEVKYEW